MCAVVPKGRKKLANALDITFDQLVTVDSESESETHHCRTPLMRGVESYPAQYTFSRVVPTRPDANHSHVDANRDANRKQKT